jgi:hypothetical protein
VRMRPAYGALGAYRKALPQLLEARELAMELGDPQLISDVLLHLCYLNSSHALRGGAGTGRHTQARCFQRQWRVSYSRILAATHKWQCHCHYVIAH